MRKAYILLLIIVIAILGACGNKEVYDNELTENERISLNIDREKSHMDEVFDLINELEVEDSKELDNGMTISTYEPAEFVRFILPEGWVNEVTYTVGKDSDNNEVESVAIVYTYRDHNIIVDYFSEGFIRKAILNQETGYVIINENDENFSKFHRDQLE